MKDDPHFKRRADEALNGLYRRLLSASDDFGFRVEFGSGILTISPGRGQAPIVVSSHPAAQHIRVTSGARQHKLAWDVVESSFTLDATGQTLQELLEASISQLVGDDVSL
ncbi:MAG TPA: frataxin domain-containing protein [Bryobacteraceae bacterium]|nr:frataxin domain-containing protein [Bryobacteraceae bacterium]